MATASLLSSVDNSNMASNSTFIQQQQQLQHQKIVSKLNDFNKRTKLLTVSTAAVAATTNALHQTVLDGRLKQFSYFLKMGSKVNSRDIYGRTCLMLACLSDHEDYGLQVARILLKNGADINIQDRLGRTSLFMACDAKREKLFNFLLDEHLSSIDLRIKDNDGNILLNHVAVHGTVRMLKKLIEKMLAKHLDIDMRNKKGNTALLLAIQNEKYLNAYVLLTHGQASPYLKDNDRFFNALEWLLHKFNLNKEMILRNQVKSIETDTVTLLEAKRSVVDVHKQPAVCSQLFETTDTSLSLPRFALVEKKAANSPLSSSTTGTIPHLPSIQRKQPPNYKTWYSSANNQYFANDSHCEHVSQPNYSIEHHKSTYIPLILTPRLPNTLTSREGSVANQDHLRVIANHSESSSSLIDTPSDYFYKSSTLQTSSQLNEIDESSTQKEIIQKLYETIYIKMFEMSVQNTQAHWSNSSQTAPPKAEPEAEKPSNPKSTKKSQSNKSSSKPVSSTPVSKPPTTSSESATKENKPQAKDQGTRSSLANAFPVGSSITGAATTKSDQSEQSESMKAKLASLNLFNLEAMRQTPKLLALIPESKITIKQGIHCIYELYDANRIVTKSTSRTTSSSMTNETQIEPRNATRQQRSKSILPSAKRSIQTASKASNKHSASTRVKFNVDG